MLVAEVICRALYPFWIVTDSEISSYRVLHR
jgi:hypothetical protein